VVGSMLGSRGVGGGEGETKLRGCQQQQQQQQHRVVHWTDTGRPDIQEVQQVGWAFMYAGSLVLGGGGGLSAAAAATDIGYTTRRPQNVMQGHHARGRGG
jgi:hypothetical protein